MLRQRVAGSQHKFRYCSDGVHQFEIKMKKFNHLLEEGVETVMWQLNRSAEQAASDDEFAVKASHVTVKLQRKGDLYLQSVLNFNLRGGYLSKAIGRNRTGELHVPKITSSVASPDDTQSRQLVRCSGQDGIGTPFIGRDP